MLIKTIVHLRSSDVVTASLDPDGDELVLDIHEGDRVAVRIFCNRQDNAALFADMVEIARPLIALTQEKQNDTETR